MKNLVEPIRNKKDVEAIEKYLAKHSLSNQLIWVFCINTGLRISDILGLNVEHDLPAQMQNNEELMLAMVA